MKIRQDPALRKLQRHLRQLLEAAAAAGMQPGQLAAVIDQCGREFTVRLMDREQALTADSSPVWREALANSDPAPGALPILVQRSNKGPTITSFKELIECLSSR
jgi:hypothetical protein